MTMTMRSIGGKIQMVLSITQMKKMQNQWKSRTVENIQSSLGRERNEYSGYVM